jgi:hypothetical protein
LGEGAGKAGRCGSMRVHNSSGKMARATTQSSMTERVIGTFVARLEC